MKLAILVLFAASLSVVSFASPNYRKFKPLRVQHQDEIRRPTHYNGPATSNQLAETTSIIPDHTKICDALGRGDEGTTLVLIDELCDRIEGGGTSPGIMETHWGLCVYDASDDRLEAICLALKKGFLQCPPPNIPGFCSRLTPY